jgi:hypothetical protein
MSVPRDAHESMTLAGEIVTQGLSRVYSIKSDYPSVGRLWPFRNSRGFHWGIRYGDAVLGGRLSASEREA